MRTEIEPAFILRNRFFNEANPENKKLHDSIDELRSQVKILTNNRQRSPKIDRKRSPKGAGRKGGGKEKKQKGGATKEFVCFEWMKGNCQKKDCKDEKGNPQVHWGSKKTLTYLNGQFKIGLDEASLEALCKECE
jgi:hypothetical protein